MRRFAKPVYAAVIDTVADDPAHPAIVWTLNAPHQWFDISVPGARATESTSANRTMSIVWFCSMARRATRSSGRRHGAVFPTQFGFELLDAAPGLHGIGKHLAFLSDNDIKSDADGAVHYRDRSRSGRNPAQPYPDDPGGQGAADPRATLADWGKERPNDLEIRRLGPVDGDSPNVHQLALRAAHNLPTFATFWLGFRDHALTRNFGGQVNVPGKVTPREGGWGFAAGGAFQLKPDEALVVTLDPLGAKYVGFQLTDPWAISTDYVHHQGSLNNRQAVPNPDGSITYVISVSNPGAANWLDPSGLLEGFFPDTLAEACRRRSMPAAR